MAGGTSRFCLPGPLADDGGRSLAAHADPPLTIEELLKQGWDIAGYVGTADVRSTVRQLYTRDATLGRLAHSGFDAAVRWRDDAGRDDDAKNVCRPLRGDRDQVPRWRLREPKARKA